jgi:hypothetical protein
MSSVIWQGCGMRQKARCIRVDLVDDQQHIQRHRIAVAIDVNRSDHISPKAGVSTERSSRTSVGNSRAWIRCLNFRFTNFRMILELATM